MAARKQPNIWFDLRLAKVPHTEGVTTYRWARRPMADSGSFKEGRILSMGSFSRGATDPDGNYELSRVSLTLSDADALFRGLLAVNTTRWFIGREGTLSLLSEEGRAAGLDPIIIFRGFVSNIQLVAGRAFQIEISDAVGEGYGRFNLNKIINIPLGAEHTNLPDGSRGLFYPLIVGEHSDKGLVNVNGEAADIGTLPVYDTGDYNLSGGDVPDPLGPPTGLVVSVVGTPGTRTQTYAVSRITANGESRYCEPVTITNAPDVRDNTNYVSLTWDTHPDAVTHRVWGRSHNPPVTWLDAEQGEGYYNDDADQDVEKYMDVPDYDTSQTSDSVYGRFVVALGALAAVQDVYVSDLAAEETPKRVRAAADLYGTYILAPGHTGWPHADPYIELSGIRMTVIYVRGPYLKQHRDGVVSIAVNACGYEEVGDGTGNVIDQAFLAGQFFLNEFVLKNRGGGYRTGDWGPLEAYSNGDAVLMTSAWEDAQDKTALFIGGAGYLASWAIHEAMTVREFVTRFCLTFNCRLGNTRHGQIRPIVIDDNAVATAGPLLVDRIHIKSMEQVLATEQTENYIEFSYDWIPDLSVYRNEALVEFIGDAIAAQVPGGVIGDDNPGGIRRKALQELFCTQDEATAYDTRYRRMIFNKWVPRYVKLTMDMSGIAYDLGDQFRLTHYDGLGASGDVATPFLVVGAALNADTLETTVIGLDIEDFIGASIPSRSPSPSASLSPSPSASPSVSPSASHSPSASQSPSASTSITGSASQSPSSSKSPSASRSPSVSPSASVSPSGSVSPTASASPSRSPSASQSPSASTSVSPSPSISLSKSPSASVSPSSSTSLSVSPSASVSPS